MLTVDLGHSLEVLDADLNVLLLALLGQVEHVGGEEGLSVLLEVSLVGLEHAVEPGEELLGAVVRVEDDGDTIVGGDGSDEVGGSGGSGDGGLLVAVGETLSTEESGTTLGDLEDDGGLDVSGSLQDGVDDGRGGDVLGGQGPVHHQTMKSLTMAYVRGRSEVSTSCRLWAWSMRWHIQGWQTKKSLSASFFLTSSDKRGR